MQYATVFQVTNSKISGTICKCDSRNELGHQMCAEIERNIEYRLNLLANFIEGARG